MYLPLDIPFGSRGGIADQVGFKDKGRAIYRVWCGETASQEIHIDDRKNPPHQGCVFHAVHTKRLDYGMEDSPFFSTIHTQWLGGTRY